MNDSESIELPEPLWGVRELSLVMNQSEQTARIYLNKQFPCHNGAWRFTKDEFIQLVTRYRQFSQHKKPKIVCLCGSTRFGEAFAEANLRQTMAGKIVLSIGCNLKSDEELFAGKSDSELQEIKHNLDELHKRKIDLADEILVLNVGGYIGDSTKSEIAYAKLHNKPVIWLEPAT